MASVWDELKRRNVVRVGIAYTVVTWLLLQVADVVLDNIEAPSWVFQAILLLLIIGFPVALIFAWAYEMTPEGLRKEKDVDRPESITHITGRKLDFVIIGVLAAALILFAVERFVLLPDRATGIAEVQQSIAVLPFVNMSSDPEQEYFSDGLSEELLNLLAKIPELKVIGRTSSFAFKGKNEDLRIIGQALGVNTLLEGSVRKSGNEVRITAQLIDASDASHIWSETYDRTMTDIFAVQDEVATAIIDALQMHVGAIPGRGRPTESSEAYELFLRARALISRGSAYETQTAKDLLLKAINLDREFAEAYEMLAIVYWAHAGTMLEAAEAQKLMGEAASRALAIEPGLVYARTMHQLGNLETYSHLGEIEALEQVMHEAPGNVDALYELAFDLIVAGYLREAVGVAERFVNLDPLSATANMRLFEALYAVGRRSEAMAALEVTERSSPVIGSWYMGMVNLLEKRDEIAIVHFEANAAHDGLPGNWVRDVVTNARDPLTGQAYLDRSIPQIIASIPEEKAAQYQLFLNWWYLYFGYVDRYFELILASELTDSSWTNAQNLVYTGNSIRRFGFTAHPKYLEVAERLGLIDIWEQRGPPDFCDKVNGQWVCQ